MSSNSSATETPQNNAAEELQRVFLEFLADLSTLYPENESIKAFQESVQGERMVALRHILPYILPHMEEISRRDHAACVGLGDQLLLVPGFSFQACWQGDGEEISQASQDALWKYLHTFYYLTCSYDKLDDLLQEFAPPHTAFKGIIRNLQNHSKISQQIISSGMFRMPGGQGVPGAPPQMPEGFPFGENSAIGQLAREIASEVDFNAFQDIKSPADLFRGMFGGAGGPSAEGAGGVGRLISTVGQKLTDRLGSGKINEASIFQEAQQMMGMMSPMMTQMMSSAFFPPGMGGGKGGFNPMDLMGMMMNPGAMGQQSGGKKSGKQATQQQTATTTAQESSQQQTQGESGQKKKHKKKNKK